MTCSYITHRNCFSCMKSLTIDDRAHYAEKLQGVCIDHQYDYTHLQSYSADEAFAVTKIILKTLKMQDLGTCRLEWIVSVYTSASTPSDPTAYHINIDDHYFPKAEAGIFRGALIDLRAIMDCIPLPQDSSVHSIRWQAYNQIYVKCKMLEDLRIH